MSKIEVGSGATRRTVTITGHWMYCRKCRQSERYAGTVIYRPEKAVDNTTWVEILALGPKCGERREFRDKADRRKQDMVPWLVNPLRVGDLAMCPDDHPWGIVRSPYDEYEYFIDECVPVAVLARP
jgi:hypothetical protein